MILASCTYMGKTIEIVRVDKDFVEESLKHNTHNRNPKKTHIEKISTDIKAGEWEFCNQGIGFDVDGVLSDGQNRLYALQAAGYPPVEILVVRGLSKKAQKVVDRHARRNLSDVFSLFFDINMSNGFIASVKLMTETMGCLTYNKDFNDYDRTKCTDGTMAELCTEWLEPYNLVYGKANSSLSAPYYTALMIYAKLNPDMALSFVAEFKSGVFSGENSPVKRLSDYRSKGGMGGGRGQRLEQFKKTVKAIIAHRNNEPISKLLAADSWEGYPIREWSNAGFKVIETAEMIRKLKRNGLCLGEPAPLDGFHS